MQTNTTKDAQKVGASDDGTVVEEDTPLSLYERHAQAQRDLVEKAESFRRQVMRHGSGTSDLAYAAWQQAKARATAIYAEIKANRERLVVHGIA